MTFIPFRLLYRLLFLFKKHDRDSGSACLILWLMEKFIFGLGEVVRTLCRALKNRRQLQDQMFVS